MGDTKSTLLEQVPRGPLGLPDPAAPPPSQLEQWLALLVGPENADCVAGIIEAILLLTGDIIEVASALEGGPGIHVLEPAHRLFTDIVKVVLSLPPKCLSDEHLAAVFLNMYEIVQLAQGSAPAAPAAPDPMYRGPQPIRPAGPGQLEIQQRIVELIQKIPEMEVLEKYPGLAEQLAATLTQAAQSADLNTQVEIIVALLPNSALQELDEALNKPASQLPGAAFIETLNDYDNKLGLNIIPDEALQTPALDLLIHVAGMTGLASRKDTGLLLGFVGLLRQKIGGAADRTVLDRVHSFVKILMRQPQAPPIEIAPEEPLPSTPPLRIQVGRDRGHLQEQRRLRRWKVLAGIK